MATEQSSHLAAFGRVEFTNGNPGFAVNRGFKSVTRVTGQPVGFVKVALDDTAGGLSPDDCTALVTASYYATDGSKVDAYGKILLDPTDGLYKVFVYGIGGSGTPYTEDQFADVDFNLQITRRN